MSGPAAPPPVTAPPAESRPPKVRTRAGSSLFDASIMRRAFGEAFVKLNPRTMIRNPVMFTVEIGSVVTTVEFISRPNLFVGLVTLWLWLTVLFANFAEAVAEGRGKAQADTLRRSRTETLAYLLQPDGTTRQTPSTELRAGHLAVVTAGQVIPGDGDVVEGMAVVDESAGGRGERGRRGADGDDHRGQPAHRQAIAAEAGVDDFLAEATPEESLALIRREQRGGHMVAMTGDGTNDAPALAQADVGLAMNTGTQAAKEAGNMVDLDSNPTKLIEVVEVAKQLLITRGSLTTFSIANDVAKYFAIIPAMFVVVYPELRVLNVMHLTNPHTAILAAVLYNALIIPALIPLALRGVKFRPLDGAAILRRNGLIYGVGGIIAPFVFIKLLDLILTALGLH